MPPNQQAAKISQAAQQAMGLPQGFHLYSPFPFGGMNVQASPLAMDDKEFLYNENFLRLGDGYLRTAWDVGTPLHTAPAGLSIVYFFFFTIGPTYYVAIFLSDGSAVQVNVATNAVTQLGIPGTFYRASDGQLPGTSQWGTLFLLIGNHNTTNDYWAWDGQLLYGAGTAAPNQIDNPKLLAAGANYSSAPTVTPFGGNGLGLTVAPTIQGGSVVELRITNPGYNYEPGDVVQLAFSGGGSDTSAILLAQLAAGGVEAVNTTAGGTGYTVATINFVGGGGVGAAASATIVGGVITDIVMTSQGSGYTSAPTVVIAGDGSGASAQALLSPGGVASATVKNGGTGFTVVPNLAFSGGGGAGAVATAILTATGIAELNVTASGTLYSAVPTVVITPGGGETVVAATATAIIANGAVVGVTVNASGSGYTSNPQITFTGGGTGATGAAASAVLQPTSIASVVVANSGQQYTNAPAILVAAGANNAAYATVALMPYGVSGTSIETFNQRVFIANPAAAPYTILPTGGNFSYSAPESLTDFATSDGGGLFSNSDRFLQTTYQNIRQSNGYLYFFGDGSVSIVSNIQTAGVPSTTTFNYQNVDPQSGLSWRDTIQDFGRSVIAGNVTGIYGLYGGNFAKVSKPLDQIFVSASFPPTPGAVLPSSACATLFDVKHYLMLMTIVDPDSGAARPVMATWNEKEWNITSQSVALTFIGTQKVSSKLYAWGTDGASLYPLFSKPSALLTKRLDTKLYGADRAHLFKDLMSFYMTAQDRSVGNVGVSATVQFAVSGPAVPDLVAPLTVAGQPVVSMPSGVYNNYLIEQPNFQAPAPSWPTFGSGTGGLPFQLISARITTTSPDFALANIMLGSVPIAAQF